MPAFNKKFLFCLLALFAVILSACNPTQAVPTIDPNMVYTQAAETVAAQLTETALAMPTATETPQPTNTPEPPTPTFTLAAPSATPTSLTPQPTFTVTVAPVSGGAPTERKQYSGDHAAWAYNTPKDGSVFNKGDQFLLSIGLINDGATTWGNGYSLNYLSGYPIGQTSSMPVTKDVKPGEKFEFAMQAIAPTEAGDYTTHWKLINPDGKFVYEVYFIYKVRE